MKHTATRIIPLVPHRARHAVRTCCGRTIKRRSGTPPPLPLVSIGTLLPALSSSGSFNLPKRHWPSVLLRAPVSTSRPFALSLYAAFARAIFWVKDTAACGMSSSLAASSLVGRLICFRLQPEDAKCVLADTCSSGSSGSTSRAPSILSAATSCRSAPRASPAGARTWTGREIYPLTRRHETAYCDALIAARRFV